MTSEIWYFNFLYFLFCCFSMKMVSTCFWLFCKGSSFSWLDNDKICTSVQLPYLIMLYTWFDLISLKPQDEQLWRLQLPTVVASAEFLLLVSSPLFLSMQIDIWCFSLQYWQHVALLLVALLLQTLHQHNCNSISFWWEWFYLATHLFNWAAL